MPVIAILLGWAVAAQAATPVPLTSLRQLHALTNDEANEALPAVFEATVLYFRSYEKTLFVQDDGAAIYVQATTQAKLVPGDRVLIKGITHESFRPFVLSNDITFLRHGDLPIPVAADYDQLIRAERDCMWVSVRARVRAADLAMNSGGHNISLQMLADGGTIDATVDSDDTGPLKSLLDADVEITGAVSGKFDGKMQQTGVLIHVPTWADVKVLRHPAADPESLPVTPMDQILIGYHIQVLSTRLRIHGTITYYQPGTAIVLQNGSKSLWVQTHSIAPMTVGDVADVTGFPGLHDGFLTLTNGAIQDSRIQAPVVPEPATWRRLSGSGNVFDLVSIEGQVVTEVREAAQDEYVLLADGQMFSAIFRHPLPPGAASNTIPAMRRIPPGARIRVTGICMLDDSNPFDAKVPFTILMRSYDDIAVLAEPSLLSIRNLMLLAGFLLIVLFAVGARGWTLERQIRRQTAALAARIEAEAALEHRLAQIESRRSRILEDINGSRPLAEILEEILDLGSFRLNGALCWCEITDGARLGACPSPSTGQSFRIVHEPIPARAGAALGTLFVAFPPDSQPSVIEAEALSVGARLASLAIETRRLYSDLLHRSEFDLLTDLHNRFSLDKLLEQRIEQARLNAGIFGLIYIDLDQFKQVNDLYGHQIGDLYLQEVALRMKRQLRSNDLLARLGGDEFAALVSVIPSRNGVEEIAQRLERCLDEPFAVEGYILRGSASTGIAVYPEDGTSRESLLSAADANMYVAKHTRQSGSDGSDDREDDALAPNNRS
ncbi:MAG TPA: GGDEF domain-containing protein [Terracidiphilus sp.]|jgi:diguanylate cyclase (GGDEF)-like protein